MRPDYTEAFFRILGGLLIVYTIFLVFRQLLRHAGVVSWPPFKTREEYLEAAAEMDLEEFIARARATPEIVKKKPEPKPPSLFQVMADIVRSLEERPVSLVDVTTTVDSSRFGTGEVRATIVPSTPADMPGFQEANATTAIGTPASVVQAASPGGVSAAQRRDEKLVKKFPLDRWFRDLAGELAQVTAVLDGMITCNTIWGTLNYLPDHLGPALPREGEWWGWKEPVVPEMACYQIPAHTPADFRGYVEKGHFAPVNFGKGELKSEPTVKLEKSRGWFRRRLTGDLIYRAADYTSGWNYYNHGGPGGGQLLLRHDDVEPAYPEAGEWWVKQGCARPHAGKTTVWSFDPVRWLYTTTKADEKIEERWPEIQAAECGCLVPVNYGKGLEQKSGVA